jgi:hypothetical protein
MSEPVNIEVTQVLTTPAEVKRVAALKAKGLSKSEIMRRLGRDGWKTAKISEVMTLVYGTYVRPQFAYNVLKQAGLR